MEQEEGNIPGAIKRPFLKKDFVPIIIELPGHGASEGEGEEEIGRYAEHVYSFLKALAVSNVFLVGHSMGGAITQTLALTHPDVIKGIVLVGTGARLKVLPFILNGIKTSLKRRFERLTSFPSFERSVPMADGTEHCWFAAMST